MLSSIAHRLVPAFGSLTVTTDAEDGGGPAPGSIVAANHTSLFDPALVLAALRRLGVEPVVMATAGLWRIPGLGAVLAREGHVPVYRRSPRAGEALDGAREALAAGRCVLIYGEGGLPERGDSGEAAPERFRLGIARLARESGAAVVPLGQAGARRVSSGGAGKQVAGLLTAPGRRPALHVHVGRPVTLAGDPVTAAEQARRAVTDAWRTAVERLGGTVHPSV
ncbi:lysophospholipid acyltransferase family protein [Streptomyces sp. NPDC088124]|uniref:lysophospholipid acyltransferase family protein n=1 Tax=Streptomyces sp. NPDC088124 TaxID=3154654 RepID=UPI003438216B